MLACDSLRYFQYMMNEPRKIRRHSDYNIGGNGSLNSHNRRQTQAISNDYPQNINANDSNMNNMNGMNDTQIINNDDINVNSPYALNNPNGKQYYENPEYYNAVNNANATVSLRRSNASMQQYNAGNNMNNAAPDSGNAGNQRNTNNTAMNGMQSFINGSINPNSPDGIMNANLNMDALKNISNPSGSNINMNTGGNNNGSQYDYNPQ